ncbi:MAG: HRDC domain-containing protein [Bryobacteraceae bacterium]
MPPFVILHDTTLVEICKQKPLTIALLMEVPGIGERKAELYGKGILDALAAFQG